MLSRRGFFCKAAAVGVATLAAPAIIRLPGLLMPVRTVRSNSLLTIDQITREAIRLWKNSNAFLPQIDAEDAIREQYLEFNSFWNREFRTSEAVGLRIRLPSQFTIGTA
jgi:hypothetical protein